eukprot:8896998-Pyramimonas_sp.AAC.1
MAHVSHALALYVVAQPLVTCGLRFRSWRIWLAVACCSGPSVAGVDWDCITCPKEEEGQKERKHCRTNGEVARGEV